TGAAGPARSGRGSIGAAVGSWVISFWRSIRPDDGVVNARVVAGVLGQVRRDHRDPFTERKRLALEHDAADGVDGDAGGIVVVEHRLVAPVVERHCQRSAE